MCRTSPENHRYRGSFDALAIGDECTYEAVLDETKGKAAAKNIVLKNGNSGGGGGRPGLIWRFSRWLLVQKITPTLW